MKGRGASKGRRDVDEEVEDASRKIAMLRSRVTMRYSPGRYPHIGRMRKHPRDRTQGVQPLFEIILSIGGHVQGPMCSTSVCRSCARGGSREESPRVSPIRHHYRQGRPIKKTRRNWWPAYPSEEEPIIPLNPARSGSYAGFVIHMRLGHHCMTRLERKKNLYFGKAVMGTGRPLRILDGRLRRTPDHAPPESPRVQSKMQATARATGRSCNNPKNPSGEISEL